MKLTHSVWLLCLLALCFLAFTPQGVHGDVSESENPVGEEDEFDDSAEDELEDEDEDDEEDEDDDLDVDMDDDVEVDAEETAQQPEVNPFVAVVPAILNKNPGNPKD